MATGCYLPRTTACFGPDMARPPAEICRLIETSLRHLHISAYGHAIESSVKSFYNYRTMTCFPLLHAIQSGLPLRIFFCKGSVGITKRQTGNGKSSSNGVERIFSFPWSLPYWMPALLRTAKNILRASWKTCWQKGKKSERMVQMDESIRKQLEKPQTWFCS